MTLRGFRAIAFLCIPLLLAACGEQTSAPDASKKVVVASEASFPPMEFVEDSGAIVGFDIDLIKAVSAAAGVGIEIRNVAWDGIFGALKSGTADVIVSSVTITDERKGQFDFSMPYLRAGQGPCPHRGQGDVCGSRLFEGEGGEHRRPAPSGCRRSPSNSSSTTRRGSRSLTSSMATSTL